MKRIFDFTVSLLALTLTSWLILVLALIIYITLGRPVIFRQVRPGLNAKPFDMIKFRSMKEVYDENGQLLPDDQRMTRLGSFLRSSSLDELPGLWCVVKGDMSLVGPRPLLTEYVPLYNKEQARRHDVKPGITGWAQVNGRNTLSWEEKFKLDTWYVDNRSLWLDLKILFMTVFKVFKRDGVAQDGHVTMEKFTGSLK